MVQNIVFSVKSSVERLVSINNKYRKLIFKDRICGRLLPEKRRGERISSHSEQSQTTKEIEDQM